MIRQLAVLAGMALLAACGLGGKEWPAPTPALWQVTAPSGQTGWLFGTIHALPDGADWRTDVLDGALDRAGALVVEISNPGDTAAQALFDRLAHTPGLPPLTARVAPAERAELRALMAAADAGEAQFADVESWGAALMLAGVVSAGDPANGVDRALLERGLHRVIALETAAQQFALFDTLPETDQSALLAATAHEAANDDARAGITAWLTGDLASLERLGDGGLLARPALRERLLAARNRAWAVRVAAIIRAGQRPFVAVGAAHMLGNDGLPALLAARGFAVRRVQ